MIIIPLPIITWSPFWFQSSTRSLDNIFLTNISDIDIRENHDDDDDDDVYDNDKPEWSCMVGITEDTDA